MTKRERYWHRIEMLQASKEGALLDLIPARPDRDAVRVWFDYRQMLDFVATIERHREESANQGTLC